MKVMYIMPRYHTNLVPTVNGWIQNGHEVVIATQLLGYMEDYSLVEPILVGYSKCFDFFFYVYSEIIKRKDPMAKTISFRLGTPNRKKLKKVILSHNPDIVILREKSLYSIACTRICRKAGKRVILYNQSPLWADSSFFSKNDIPHRVVDALTPKYRITPVNKIGLDTENYVKDSYAEFAPFVMMPDSESEHKEFFCDGMINILEVGKYEIRKNHLMMVDVFEKIHKENSKTRLTIVGENSNKFHEDYFRRLEDYICDKGLHDSIILKCNLSKSEMANEYRKADVFVLPSTAEPAAISHIEAMSYSLPAISSTGNGTADYILDGETGYIFEDNDSDDLYNKLHELVSDRDELVTMGQNAYQRVKEHCSFDKYYEAVIKQAMKD